ncbi:MAG: MoxR family ATPase [Thermaerobacter sp.]|nr:MoxR family ATPase [Thermaerobacter sp.]
MAERERSSQLDPRVERVLYEVSRQVVGKHDAALRILCAVVAGGHVLLEDVPGVGKTLLAKSLASSLDLRFSRIQATSDLLPSDIVGVHIYDPSRQEFDFRPGPVFAEIVLVDEINRASPRAQSALLEAMEEGQVTAEGHTYPLSDTFTVLATQNPAEHEGTYALPSSQLDRFLFKLHLDYPQPREEEELLRRMSSEIRPQPLTAAITRQDVLSLRREALATHVSQPVLSYVQEIARATRVHPEALLGASPRAGVALLRAAKVWARLHGRGHVLPDDIRDLAHDALAHRLHVRSGRPEACLDDVLASLPVPRESRA